METIEPIITLVTSLWDRVTSAPAHLLLMLVLNIVGAVLKRIPEVNNRTIPIWLMALGTIGYSLMASPGTVSPDVRNPWLVLGLFGFVLGFGAWLLHVFIFRKLGQHLPDWLKKEFDGSPLLLALCFGLSALLLGGCMSVPETVIRYDKRKEAVIISSPKDVTIDRAFIQVESNRVVRIDFEGYSAKNNIKVLEAIAVRNQSVMENAVKAGGVLMGEAISHMK